MLNRSILVLAWPTRAAVLVNVPVLGAPRVVAEGPAEENLPAECRGRISEVRIVIGAGVFYRLLEIPGVKGAALKETATFAAEPTLPLPLDALRTLAVPMGRRREGRVLLAAIPESQAAAAISWASRLLPDGPPVRWMAPAVSVLAPGASAQPEALSGDGWAAMSLEGAWVAAVAARTEEDARAAALASGTVPTAWRHIDLKETAVAIARAPLRRAWSPSLTHAEEDRPRRWPVVLAALALVFALAAFGLRSLAAEKRIAAADEIIAASFAESMPGSKPVAPGEQIRRALMTMKREHGALADRLARRGSALSAWMLIDQSAPPIGIRLDDLRITPEAIQATGSAISVEVIQEFVRQLNAKASTTEPAYAFREPETRRTPAGLGVDFTLRGEPAPAGPEGSRSDAARPVGTRS